MRHLIWFSVICFVTTLLSACGPLADVPLVDPKDAKQDPRLYGSWVEQRVPSADQHFLHVGADPIQQDDTKEPAAAMQAWLISLEQKRAGDPKASWDVYCAGPPIGFRFTPFRIGDSWVASISCQPDITLRLAQAMAKDEKSDVAELTSGRERFWFTKYEVDQDELVCWLLNEEFVIRAIKNGELKGAVTRMGTLLFLPRYAVEITDSQENLRRFFEQNIDHGLFDSRPLWTFQRLRVP